MSKLPFTPWPRLEGLRPCLWYAILLIKRETAQHLKTMTLQAQALTAGYAVVDMGKAGMQIQGFRYLVKRLSDNAIYHFATAKQVREQLAA